MDNSFYSPIEPYATGWLELDAPHKMYYEESGNPNGAPVIFLHGGPGAGASPNHRRFFDPDFYRIIIFDQRGAGRSHPYLSLEANTTQHLIADIEAIVDGDEEAAALYAGRHVTRVRRDITE